MRKQWVLKKPGEKELVEQLAKELKIQPSLVNLLVQRGITTFDEARSFFRPELTDLHDPFLMKDMDKAVRRIEKAIENKEKILIYGDYDVDGTTAVAMVYLFLKESLPEISIGFYVPDRDKEGYGISLKGIEYAYQNHFTLVIALDCGVKNQEAIALAQQKNIDFIVCDHHLPGDTLPPAIAVLDPKRTDCKYPYKELSGCGVGFKLIQALAHIWNYPDEKCYQYLDLVVVSIAADIVPITGENRVLAYYGLKLLNQKPRPGFDALLYYSGVKKNPKPSEKGFYYSRELTISDLVFLLGPRINAAGRIELAKNSVELLICDNSEFAHRIAERINAYNTERKTLDQRTTEQALAIIDNSPELQARKTTTVFNPEWHKGVIGIVASRLTEKYYRPTIVMTESNGLVTGSARSVRGFDIHEAIGACSHLLEHYGGHSFAAGLALKFENLQAFIDCFESVVANTITDDLLKPKIDIDDKISLNEITPQFTRILKQFAPFGPENMAPVFLSEGIVDTGQARIVGANHLKLNVIDQYGRGPAFEAIAFQKADYFPEVQKGKPFEICYHVDENEWNGNTCIQLNIKEIKI